MSGNKDHDTLLVAVGSWSAGKVAQPADKTPKSSNWETCMVHDADMGAVLQEVKNLHAATSALEEKLRVVAWYA